MLPKYRAKQFSFLTGKAKLIAGFWDADYSIFRLGRVGKPEWRKVDKKSP
jgi:hypothetical protein